MNADDKGTFLSPTDVEPLFPSIDDLANMYGQSVFGDITPLPTKMIAANSDVLPGSSGMIGGVEQSYSMNNLYSGSEIALSIRILIFNSAQNAKAFVSSYYKPKILYNVSYNGFTSFSARYASAGAYPAVSESATASAQLVVWAVARDSDKHFNHTSSTMFIADELMIQARRLFL